MGRPNDERRGGMMFHHLLLDGNLVIQFFSPARQLIPLVPWLAGARGIIYFAASVRLRSLDGQTFVYI